MQPPSSVPLRAWVVTFAGTAVNLCLGILYAWSVWKGSLIADPTKVQSKATAVTLGVQWKLVPGATQAPGQKMDGLNEGWVYLSKTDGTVAYSICGVVFALTMILGGRLQDRYGPKLGSVLGGLSLAGGCILAGLMKSNLGLILGFGLLGGIGMGLGYAAATPAAVKWFGPQLRGLIVGLVVGGYGGAAIYISPLADSLITHYGISGSFIGLGLLFAVVVVVAGLLLSVPPPGYVAPGATAAAAATQTTVTRADWPPSKMLRTWQFYALVFLFIGSAQSGLLVIANAAPMLKSVPDAAALITANAWLLAAFGGFVNAFGRVGTGLYSDAIGRRNAYIVNGAVSAVCLLLTPMVKDSGNVPLLFVVVGVAYWQYGGGLALLPAFTADFFGPKNLGFNYGLVFIGWGIAFFVPLLGGYIEDVTQKLDYAFYLSGCILIAAVLLSLFVRRPADETANG